MSSNCYFDDYGDVVDQKIEQRIYFVVVAVAVRDEHCRPNITSEIDAAVVVVVVAAAWYCIVRANFDLECQRMKTLVATSSAVVVVDVVAMDFADT